MRILAVETSSPIFSVAVCEGPQVRSFVQVDGQGRPSALLTDLIEKACAEAGLEIKGLDGFAISIGPGSFTGLRVGVMTVKTLAWALQKPVIPVSSLETISRNVQQSSKPVLLFLDARKGNVYSALFRPNGKGTLVRATPDELLSPAEALRRITEPTLVMGDGLRKYDVPGAEQAPADQWIPRADRVAEIAAVLWLRLAEAAPGTSVLWPDGRVDDIHRLVPQYLYSKEGAITQK